MLLLVVVLSCNCYE